MSRKAAIAITGAGCLCAAGPTLDACMASMLAGHRAPAPPRAFTSGHPVRYPVFEVPEAFFPPTAPEDTGRFRTSRLALAAAQEAMADSGWDAEDLKALRVGVVVGTTVGSAMNNEAFYREYREGGHPDMAPIERFLRSNPARSVAEELGLSGPVQTVVNACSSGTDALGTAAAWLRNGICDLVLAGGADELCRTTYNGFISLMITDAEPARPFDRDRRGLNLGEGAAMLVMEAEALARRRPRRARAFLAAYGAACDGHHLTAPHPEGKGLRETLREVFSVAGCAPEDIAFVNAHGTGTPDNDRVEAQVLEALLPGVPYLSTKGYTGHTLGAAGAIEAAFTLACLEQGRVPANVGFNTPDPAWHARPVERVTAVQGRFALSQSLAFGGNNAAVLLERGDRP